MGAFVGMTALLGNLVPIAERLGYLESSICVLKGDIDVLEKEFPKTYSNLMGCNHNRDNRAPIQYGKDLVASWIYEDFLMEQLQLVGITIEGAGADKNREILAHAKVSAASDCLVIYNGKSRKLEIMNDYKGYWAKNRCLDLRDAKYNKLSNENSIFLGVAPLHKKYVLLDFSENVEATFIPHHPPYGFKPVYQVPISQDALKELDFTEITQEVLKLF